MDENKKQINIPLLIGGLVLVIIIGGGITFAITNVNKNEDNNTNTVQTDNSQVDEDNSADEIDEIDEDEALLDPIVETPVNSTIQNPPTDPVTPTTPTETPVARKYADGTYSSTGTYNSPAGTEEVEVSLTVANDAVISVTVTPMASNPSSKIKQNAFAEGISGVIVGKKLDEVVYPGSVNGSSLTGNGFIDAVNDIKIEASV